MRTVPQWIRDKALQYERARKMWVWAGYLQAVCSFAAVVFVVIPWNGGPIGMSLALPGCLVLSALKPSQRALRYDVARDTLNAAIRRYRAEPEQPESSLIEADRQATEALHVNRVRTAPAWVRDKLRRCRLESLAWTSPIVLAVVLPIPFLWLRWTSYSIFALMMGLLVLGLAGVATRGRKLRAAGGILGAAIERYEFESPIDESSLVEAGRRAEEALGR